MICQIIIPPRCLHHQIRHGFWILGFTLICLILSLNLVPFSCDCQLLCCIWIIVLFKPKFCWTSSLQVIHYHSLHWSVAAQQPEPSPFPPATVQPGDQRSHEDRGHAAPSAGTDWSIFHQVVPCPTSPWVMFRHTATVLLRTVETEK